jgi:hypothetical protein
MTTNAADILIETIQHWKRVVDSRAKRLFEDSRFAPSEAYGGQRAAT